MKTENLPRPSDQPADELLLELARKFKAENEEFQPVMEVEMLKSEIDYLDQHGIKDYFPKSFKLLSSWVPNGAKYAQETHDEIKANITQTYQTAEKRYAQYKYDEKRPTSDWLSGAMEGFVPRIAELSEKPDGLMLAIDLFLYLGEHSFTKMEEWQQILDPINGRPAREYLDGDAEPISDTESIFGTNFGPRPSDGPADTLLLKLVQKAKVDRGGVGMYKMQEHINSLRKSIKYLAKFRIDNYFRESFSLLGSHFTLVRDSIGKWSLPWISSWSRKLW